KPYFKTDNGALYQGDALKVLSGIDSESVQCCITSPPYWGLRDYGVKGQLGLEKTPEEYVSKMVEVFREVRRVLRKDGTLWLNMGDYYATGAGKHKNAGGEVKGRWGHDNKRRFTKDFPQQQPNRLPLEGLKQKDLVGIPWRVAFALQSDGWWLRQDIIEEVEIYCPCCGWQLEERIWRHGQDREIIWKKPNPMPESVTDRCTKSHEYIFLMSKSAQYSYDNEAIKEPVGPKGNANSFRGGAYCNGNINNALLGKRTISGNTKVATYGKHSIMDPQSSGRRMVENVKRARAEGAGHDNMFGTKRNKRSVWTVATKPYKEAHFATFPPDLILPCILAGTAEGQTILDPFAGSGTVWEVCEKYNRKSANIELSVEYCQLIKTRIINKTRQLKLF
ncbi:site-specific DNA-methyltransferase, partial [Candidatus Pacearchaeota archaeon]|nr:site-specific DNA-methyltransferase [Candidatus Pacearchaeota archaeon]